MLAKVDTSKMLITADNIDQINMKIENSAKEVEKNMNRLSSCWSGAAAERIMALYYEIRDNYINVQSNVVSAYSTFIRDGVYVGYDITEDINTELSQEFK